MPTQPITARELRIGNLVQNQYGVNITVDAHKIYRISIGDLKTSGIPLTPEWLERFGFEKLHQYWHNGMGLNVFYDLENQYVRQASFNGKETVFTISAMNVIYVHQLQNLYFALNGQELTPNK